MHKIPASLTALIARQASQPPPPWIAQLGEALCKRHGAAVQAVLAYGSCLYTENQEGIADFYVLVDHYRNVYDKRLPALFNKLLPPNVFYLEAPLKAGKARAKYAIVSLTDFERGTSQRCFHSYLWGRFAQPSRIVFTRSAQIHARVVTALAQAVRTFLIRIIPRFSDSFTVEELWRQGLLLSYQAELRAERAGRTAQLFALAPTYYREITQAARPALPFAIVADPEEATDCYRANVSAPAHWQSGAAWRMRRTQGKLLSVLRLIKGALTFQGGLDYLAWKIERHSGVGIEITPPMRRHPVLAGLGIFWRTYRRGGFR
jgi:hypothetical protein